MKSLFALALFVSTASFSQPAETLSGRYGQLKDKSQTFKDYKVIKETSLDSFWQSVEDSLTKQQTAVAAAIAETQVLKAQQTQLELSVQRREAAVEEIVFDSTHITVLGIAFHKAVFMSAFFIIVASLLGLLLMSLTRGQLLQRSLKEKAETMLILSSEFEDYKHRAVEKQMKLSRELQNERNKLSEIRPHH